MLTWATLLTIAATTIPAALDGAHASEPAPIEVEELCRFARPDFVRRVDFREGEFVLSFEDGGPARHYPYPVTPGTVAESPSAVPTQRVLLASDGSVAGRVENAEGGLLRVELVDGSVRTLPANADGTFQASPSGILLDYGRELHGGGAGFVELSIPGEARVLRRKFDGLESAFLSPDGETLFVRTRNELQVHRSRALVADPKPRFVVGVTGSFRYLPAAAKQLPPSTGGADSTAFSITLFGATSLYAPVLGKEPLLRLDTVGFAKGVEWLRSGLVVVAEADRVHLWRAAGGGALTELGIEAVPGDGYAIASVASHDVGPDGTLVALGLRRVQREHTRKHGGEALVGVRILRVALDGEVRVLADERGLESRSWSFASPRVTWAEEGDEALLHTRDAVWTVRLP